MASSNSNKRHGLEYLMHSNNKQPRLSIAAPTAAGPSGQASPGQLLQQVFQRTPAKLSTSAFMACVGATLDKLPATDQAEWKASLQAMLGEQNTSLQAMTGEQRTALQATPGEQKTVPQQPMPQIQIMVAPMPAPGTHKRVAEELTEKLAVASERYIKLKEFEECDYCLRNYNRQVRCGEHESVDEDDVADLDHEVAGDASQDLQSVILDWHQHLVSQLRTTFPRTVETCATVFDGLLHIRDIWTEALEGDCTGYFIEWPKQEPWPVSLVQAYNDEDDGEGVDVPTAICHLWRDVLLCLLAFEKGLPATDPVARSEVAAQRKRALIHLNCSLAGRLPPRSGVLGALVDDTGTIRTMPQWHDAAMKGNKTAFGRLLALLRTAPADTAIILYFV
ncbi:hypothetical protein CF319_g5098 [Tilletia indica]|nr:hypothetical protein CF319_g5098 [Tilletia indica]KAE8231064.1 hypothetical protein CF326_g3925 [Tilletia indica]